MLDNQTNHKPLLNVAVVAFSFATCAIIGWNSYELGRSRADVEGLTHELDDTKAQVSELRKDHDPERLALSVARVLSEGATLKANWTTLDKKF